MDSNEQDKLGQYSYEAPYGGSVDDAEEDGEDDRAGGVDAIGNAFAHFSTREAHAPYLDEAAEEGGEAGNESVVIRDRAGGIKF
jgi:hypothetical protein